MPRFYADLARHGTRVALIREGHAWTYRDLADEAGRVARSIPPATLVFLEADNGFASIAAYVGCLVGAHPVLLTSPGGAAVPDLIERYRPGAIVRADGSLETNAQAGTAALHPALRVLLSTSGSTGSPKYVKLSDRNLTSNAAAIAGYLELDAGSRAITSLKPHYSYGLSVINSHLAVGGSLILTNLSVTDEQFWPTFVAGGADSFAGVPYTFEMLRQQDFDPGTIAGLRTFTQAGGRLAPDLVRHFAARAAAAGQRMVVMYGQTEASPRMAYLPPERAADFPDCIGVAIPGGTLELLAADGAAITDLNVAGELSYRGPNVMMGYAQGAADLAGDETPERLLTGDIAVWAAPGIARIVGRTARFVKPFGVRTSLDEVEAWARARFAGAVCANREERIGIFVPGAVAADDLAGLARDVERRFGLPALAVTVLPVAAVPHLDTGKIDYRRLAGLLDEDLPAGPGRVTGVGGVFRIVTSAAFRRQVLLEAADILGLRAKTWDSVEAIYRAMLSRPHISAGDTFAHLSGDSLTYVQVSLALQEYLGLLPEGWEAMPVAELEGYRQMPSL